MKHEVARGQVSLTEAWVVRPCGRVGTPDKLRGDVWEEDVEGGKHELLAWGEPSHRLNSPMERPRGQLEVRE